jgi:hypothetical protein
MHTENHKNGNNNNNHQKHQYVKILLITIMISTNTSNEHDENKTLITTTTILILMSVMLVTAAKLTSVMSRRCVGKRGGEAPQPRMSYDVIDVRCCGEGDVSEINELSGGMRRGETNQFGPTRKY